MTKTTTDLKDIVRLGGSISVEASTKTTTDLKDIARILNLGATLTIRNASVKTTTDLKDIARLAPGNVIFEF
jgi:hypothetical protein